MTYYYKGAKILAPLTIRSNEPIYEVDTVSLTKQRASQGVQRWEISFNTVTSGDTEADMLVGTITNMTASTTITMPQIPSVVAGNTAGVSLVINANVNAGLSAVIIASDGVIKKGSFIKFSNHDKLYMVTADVAAIGTLTGSIDATASTSVVGVGTAFTTELVVGDSILVTGETRTVATITDDTNLTVTAAFTDTLNDTSPEKVGSNVAIYPSLRTAVTTSHTLKTGSSAVLSYYRDIDTLTGLTFADGLISNAGTITLIEAI